MVDLNRKVQKTFMADSLVGYDVGDFLVVVDEAGCFYKYGKEVRLAQYVYIQQASQSKVSTLKIIGDSIYAGLENGFLVVFKDETVSFQQPIHNTQVTCILKTENCLITGSLKGNIKIF